MAWTVYQVFLVAMLIISGSITTLSLKWTDEMTSPGRDGKMRNFYHPFMQTMCMFIGEIMCFILFKILFCTLRRRGDGSEERHELTKGNLKFNRFILMLPAMCEMLAESLFFIGLNLTYASSYQMLRGSEVIFVGVLSMIFLHRIIKMREWFGMILIVIGLAVVGISDYQMESMNSEMARSHKMIIGDVLIVLAQVMLSIQIVIEEKENVLDIPPLYEVGWEGIFGFMVLSLLLIPFFYIHVPAPFNNNSRGVLEDIDEAFIQIGNNYMLVLPIICTITSFAFFSFAGISIIKKLSGTGMVVLHNMCTVVIWIFSMIFLHQPFGYLQLVGFIILSLGMCIYNNICGKAMFKKIRMRFVTAQQQDIASERALEPEPAPEPVNRTISRKMLRRVSTYQFSK